jgi:Zn ribbon nucleic-acid-binding protein
MPIDEYCPECGHSDYDRHDTESGRRVVKCKKCGFREVVSHAE